MTKSINLQKSKEITTALKAIEGLTCFLRVPNSAILIRSREIIIRLGIPATIKVIDQVLDLQYQVLAIGHEFARFLADHPDAPRLGPEDFAHGSTEREVLTYFHTCLAASLAEVNGDDDDDDDDDAWPDRTALIEAIEDALPHLYDDEQHEPYLTKAEALHLLADAQANIDRLIAIRNLLAPLMDDAPPLVTPTAGRRKTPNDIVVRIDERLRSHIPALKPDEYKQLEDNILAHGCQSPLILWDGVLLDGHNRYDICTRHDVPFRVETIDLPDFEAATAWIEENQLGRRNLTADQFAYYIGRKYERLKKAEGGRSDRDLSGDHFDHPKTSEIIAERHGISAPTVRRAAAFARDVDTAAAVFGEEARPVLLSGEEKLSRKDVAELASIALEAKAAAAEPEQQVQAVDTLAQAMEIAARRRRLRKKHTEDHVQCEVDQLMAAWGMAGDEARRLFLERIGHAPQADWHTTSDAVH